MAFTSSQRNAITLYLGGPTTGWQVDLRVRNAIDAVESLHDADLEARIVALLGNLADIDAQLLSSRTRYKFKRVEDVEYNIGGEVGSLVSLGNLLLGRLSTALACPIITNPYARNGSAGGVMRHG